MKPSILTAAEAAASSSMARKPSGPPAGKVNEPFRPSLSLRGNKRPVRVSFRNCLRSLCSPARFTGRKVLNWAEILTWSGHVPELSQDGTAALQGPQGNDAH